MPSRPAYAAQGRLVIKCAAFRHASGLLFSAAAPAHHEDILTQMLQCGVTYEGRAFLKGFLDANGRFKTCKEAAVLVGKLDEAGVPGELCAQDLW